MKSQINIRASQLLQRQLDQLTEQLGTSITETISLAIDRMYQQEIKTMNDRQRATKRVNDTPELQPYRDILIDYEWDNQDDHLEWVAAADLSEILSWCRTVERDNLADS